MTQPPFIDTPKTAFPPESLRSGSVTGWRRAGPRKTAMNAGFEGDAALDPQIEARFGPAVRLAVQGGLHSRLALAILLDLFTRNVFRGSTAAMRAQQLTLQTLAHQQDLQVAVGQPRVHVHAADACRRCRIAGKMRGLLFAAGG